MKNFLKTLDLKKISCKIFNMDKEKIINKIIPADDLHWNEEEKKYVSLSDEEINSIIATCISQNIKEEKNVYKIVKWAGLVRIGNILLDNFLKDRLDVMGFDNNDEPLFKAKD
jgi:hypothetical protein